MKKVSPKDGTKEEIFAQICRLAASYTPEWKIDMTHPDMGVALAEIFADMYSGTVRRYNRIPEKLYRGFFAQLGEKMRPSIPAEGYVAFCLSSPEFGGTMLPEGTVVMASGGEGADGESIYETMEDLYVTPAEISQLIYMDGQEDYIEKKDWKKPFTPFSPEHENLQEHVLYLCQNEVLSVTGGAEILLQLKTAGVLEGGEETDWLLDKKRVSIAYGSGERFLEFKSRSKKGDTLVLKKDLSEREPAKQELFNKEGYWIRIRCLTAWNREPFMVRDIRLSAKRDGIKPDMIQTEMGEQRNEAFFPFGESPALFRECYFAAGEALGKVGAKIRLTFRLDYEKVPLDNSIRVERNWKIVMKRSDFIPDPEYDITIEQVVWEYYNGSGWSRLPVGTECENLFNGRRKGMGEQIELEFICPKDAALLEWQCAPTRYIRVRVLRMNNLFQLKGTYITPVIGDIRFHYAYSGEGRHPEYAAASNQREITVFPVGALERENVCWEIFSGQRRRGRSLYLGFDRPLTKGPIRIYCGLAAARQQEQPGLVFEYSGKKGFKPLTVLDKTDALRKSGTLTFSGKEDFTQSLVCGERAYWIRITEDGDDSGSKDALSHGTPKQASAKQRNGMQEWKIENMFLNAAKIQATHGRQPEYFFIEAGEKNKVCRLLKDNVHTLSVWVNEISTITPIQRENLRQEGRVEETRDVRGQLTGIWVKWQETVDFRYSREGDRHYLSDRTEGTVTFSDGKRGAIPPSGEEETIRIEYRCGGGAGGNQPPGAIGRIGASFGFVKGVTNPMPVCGGCAQETVSIALKRGAQTLRHGNRAVTAGDYEALAIAASRHVQKVKCFSGYNEEGGYEPGSITLVVLSGTFDKGRMYFQRIREEILSCLSCRMGGNLAVLGHLYVTEPQFVEINTYVKVVTGDAFRVLELQRDVKERLDQFLHPVTGNYHGKGWDIGKVPNETQMINAIKEVSGIRFVKEFRMTSLRSDLRFAVALSGTHIIEVEAEE